ncbi:MAG: MBL fold metallo-hydrolase [Candidatus Micrarchaeia archaeon]
MVRLKFLGTNGWYSSESGYTVCTAISAPGRLIALDAGDGFQDISEIAKLWKTRRIDVFLSHLHLDHVSGLHTLAKLEGFKVRIFVHKSYLPALKKLIAHPFTANEKDLARFGCSLELFGLKEGVNSIPYKVQVLPLVHADPCFGFRFSLGGKSIAYCTDTRKCENMLKLAKNADLLISECSFPPGKRPHTEWPHLNPEMAAEMAKKAGAKRLVLTHFDATQYAKISLRKEAEKAAKRIFKNCSAALDGMEVELRAGIHD